MLLILFITVIATKVDLCGPQHILEKCIAIPIILLFFQAILKFQVDLNIKTTRMLCYLKPEASPLDDRQKTLSAGVNFSGFGVPVSVGQSIEKTNSLTWAVSNTSSRTIEKTAPKGYYSYNVCMNIYKIRVEKWQGSSKKGSIVFNAPRSQAYRSIVYNRSNASYSNVSRY